MCCKWTREHSWSGMDRYLDRRVSSMDVYNIIISLVYSCMQSSKPTLKLTIFFFYIGIFIWGWKYRWRPGENLSLRGVLVCTLFSFKHTLVIMLTHNYCDTEHGYQNVQWWLGLAFQLWVSGLFVLLFAKLKTTDWLTTLNYWIIKKPWTSCLLSSSVQMSLCHPAVPNC